MLPKALTKSTKQEVLSVSTKAQAWYMDFAIALLLFTFTLVIYFSYTNNFQKQEEGELNIMFSDAKAISSSLALSGYPTDWTNETVIRIGVADEQNVNATKVKTFKKFDYQKSRRLFGTIYDYIAFFVNNKGEVLNVNSVCILGYPLINTSYKTKSAYYYQDDVVDFKLRDFMNETFSGDIYFDDQSNDIFGLHGLMSNISKYGFIVIEQPKLSGGDYNKYKDKINNFTSTGGIFMLSGELVSGQDKDLVGATFRKKSGDSISDRNSTVNNTDKYLALTVGENIVFRQAYYVENESDAIEFKQIATFNKDGRNALSRWKYGNGTVYFFSDFDVSYFDGDFVDVVKEAAKALVEGICYPINVSTVISPKKLVKTERYLTYNSKVVKMVTYVWQ